MSTGGFYEGGYSGYGGSSTNNIGGGGYTGGGSQDAFGSGSMGSSSMSYSQTQPMKRPNASSSSSSQKQEIPSQNIGNPNAMNYWDPATVMAASKIISGGANSDAMIGMAEHMGMQFLETGWAKAIPGLERSMVALRVYFAVDNAYVKRKMLKVLFPFTFREWKREEAGTNPDGTFSYALPHHDVNAPDLYIPFMSLITYVLLCALCYGTAGQFNPEVLPDVTSKCLATQILEVIAIRVGFYLMEAPVAMLDLFSYTGYKYLGLSVNMLNGLALGHFVGYGHRAYYFTFLWTAVAVSFFILKVMANIIPRKTSAVGPKRQFMVLGFALSQLATCWFVSQTKFLE